MTRLLRASASVFVVAASFLAQTQAPSSTSSHPPQTPRPAFPTRDPHTPGYVPATELPDGAIPSPTADGNFIIGPTHTPAPEIHRARASPRHRRRIHHELRRQQVSTPASPATQAPSARPTPPIPPNSSSPPATPRPTPARSPSMSPSSTSPAPTPPSSSAPTAPTACSSPRSTTSSPNTNFPS